LTPERSDGTVSAKVTTAVVVAEAPGLIVTSKTGYGVVGGKDGGGPDQVRFDRQVPG
jgi:hypothetical protein